MSDSEQSQDAQSAHIQVRDKDGTMMKVPLRQKQILIGRSNQSGLQLNSNSVSRQHAELYCDPFGQWWLRDLGSRNGTVINGEQVYQDAQLDHGDQLLVGRFEMVFYLDAAPIGTHTSQDAPASYDEPVSVSPSFPGDDDDENDNNDWEAPPVSQTRRKPFVIGNSTDLSATVPIVPIGMDDDSDKPIASSGSQPKAKIDTIHLSTLAEFGNRLTKTDDTKERLRLLCRLMVRNDYHGRSAVALRTFRNPKQRPEVLCQPQLSLSGGNPPNVSRKLLMAVTKSEAPILLTPASRDLGAPPPRGTAAIACPLRVDKDFVDVLHVTMPEAYGSVEWMALITLAAQQYMQTEAAIAVRKQAEITAAMERELASARKIQMNLVPTKTRVKGLDVTVGFEPCKWVGGDYADVVKRPDGRVLLVLADVCGKGLPAALVTSSLHTMVHVSARADLDLQAMMNNLNEHLCESLAEGTFVTMVAVDLDPATGKLECVNAGHPPIFVLDPNGGLRHLQHSANLPLGIAPRPLSLEKDTLELGHLLTLYSDGLTELPDENGQLLGVEELGQYLMAIYAGKENQPVELCADALIREMEKLDNGRDPTDDRTFLLARRAIPVKPKPVPAPPGARTEPKPAPQKKRSETDEIIDLSKSIPIDPDTGKPDPEAGTSLSQLNDQLDESGIDLVGPGDASALLDVEDESGFRRSID